ncbi:type II secretion system pilot lipoprotein GspS-beta [Vibrio europaeus]|uniref:type II secretion system pilot lipoprotein GspS-beta n=1 Tax=Vibrio europaeus TaxID=300876 RepID=UPI00233E6A30|nr:type II secretion system pilot lipoprotein GspS-beta [Vibrio europaeus]MDC5718396.1 type II secretion system pilot lipoprotein GspS-beta [Vibrio europaeus]MDC5851194.1 type II secretion system pilot lipoprotein GspS-beta [Vibrio europaeus]
MPIIERQLSRQLPIELGSLTLVDAQSQANIVTLVSAKKKNFNIDRLVDPVAVSFYDNIELKPLLESKISYRVISLEKMRT